VLLLVCACAREPGVSVQIVPAPGLPPMDRAHLVVLQGGVLLPQDKEDFALGSMSLPGTVVVQSWVAGEGKLQIVVQGLSGNTVQARGEATAQLTTDSPYKQVTLVLVQLCSGATCGLVPSTCPAQNAKCGTVDDQAGGYLDCGTCPAGQTCGAGGPHQCGKGSCTPTASCSSLDAGCGYVFDGCQMVSCGDCRGNGQCSVSHSCACTPTRTCASTDAGCLSVDDGCGTMLGCETCTPPQTCGGGSAPNHCGCTPACAGKACGTVDGCGGRCQTGTCSGGMSCMGGSCVCPQGQTPCPNGGCANLLTDPLNCGSCGHACTKQAECANGACTCAQPADNADGHCCPTNFDFQFSADMSGPYCFSQGVAGPTSIDVAETICTNLMQGKHACVGFGAVVLNGAPNPIPQDAGCGSYFDGRAGAGSASPLQTWVSTYRVGGAQGLHLTNDATCSNTCDGGAMAPCICDCFCSSAATGCQQPFYCVTDPLAPRRATCIDANDCPGGTYCDGGACVASADYGCCVSARTCDLTQPAKSCRRTGRRATGYCQ
jgi:hypothetical protein